MRVDDYLLPLSEDVAQQELLIPLDLVEVVVLQHEVVQHEVVLVQEDNERA